jgi:glycosyltransferase involved in cell wall biosynthesis
MALAAPLFWARTQTLRAAWRSADHFVAPSHLAARIFAGHGGPAAKITVVPDVVLDAHLPRRSPEARDASGPIRCVYIGSLIPAKGLHVAVEAFNGVTDPHARLHLYGDPAADPGYVERLRRLARHPGIELKGLLPREAVAAVLQDADLLVQPSLWYETYAIVVDEALSAGVPVLVSDHGAPAERVVPDVNGLTAPPGDVAAWQCQLQRFLDDPDLRRRLRQGARPPPLTAQHVLDMEAIYARL